MSSHPSSHSQATPRTPHVGSAACRAQENEFGLAVIGAAFLAFVFLVAVIVRAGF